MLSARFLGDSDILLNGHSVDLNWQAKMMLAYLAHSCPKRVTREQLARVFWPEKQDSRPESARRSLNVEINHIRAGLRAISTNAADLIVFEGNSYGICGAARAHSDVAVFKARCKKIQMALRNHEPVRNMEFHETIALYKGNFLRDCPENALNWVDLERQHLAALLEDLVESYCAQLFAQSEHRLAASVCQDALAHDQRMEAIHRCLMTAYANMSKLNLVENQYRLARQSARQ
jgi:Response regulator containing CheY-like receiver and SARP domains